MEETNETVLPEVQTRIADIKHDGALAFQNRLREDKTTLFHLAEGVDQRARSFFRNLQISDNNWAITDRLNGIHCAGLKEEDFEIMAKYEGTMTWSPFSNILLYGDTAKIKSARSHGILMALESDWSPSGSKNLLEEIKVAKLVSDSEDGVFSDSELVQMITINPAKILGWQDLLGSIEIGKKADLVIINGYRGDPYSKLIEATERNIYGAFINGVPRYTTHRIMSSFSSKFAFDNDYKEDIKFSGSKRCFYTYEADPDNFISGIKLSDAYSKLSGGLLNIKHYAEQLEQATVNGIVSATDNPLNLDWFLMADFHEGHIDTSSGDYEWGASIKYSTIATALPLDQLTVIGDDEHFLRLREQPNLTDILRNKLPLYYGRSSLGSYQNSFTPSDNIHNSLNLAVSLETFRKRSSNLSKEEKLLILKQARLLIDQVYVHKVLKQWMYAINPIEKINKMINDIQYDLNITYTNDNQFHHELLQIFSSLRDLHTKYYLPDPYSNRFAFLPFLIEEYYETQEDESPKFIVSKVFKTIVHQDNFTEGVQVLRWNNIPIERVVELNAANQSGSNPDAHRARSIDTLTIRSLGSGLPPDEVNVTLTCLDQKGKTFQVNYEWLVSYYPPNFNLSPDEIQNSNLAFGCDYDTLAINEVKLGFYITGGEEGKKRPKPKGWIWPPNNSPMRGRTIPNYNKNPIGYIRLFSFSTDNEQDFVQDFIFILESLKKKNISGLIIDIRGNGGGLITACELLLAKLSGKRFKAQSFQFLSTGVTIDLSSIHDRHSGLTDLSPWKGSLVNSKSTGEVYSLGFPISDFKEIEHQNLVFDKPMVLITDALCYSSADMFAAGFQDLNLGKIIGVHGNTGAGGVNVWSHKVVSSLWKHNRDIQDPFYPLPKGTNITVAVRRTLRTSGYPLEDIGVSPDIHHKMTKKDLTEGNIDLINRAIRELLQKES